MAMLNLKKKQIWMMSRRMNDSHKNNVKDFLFLHKGIFEAIFPCIIDAFKAKDAWEILKNKFQGDDAKMFTSEMHDPYVRTTGAWK